jgi:hypothetical protein
MLNPLIELQISNCKRAKLVPRVANVLWKLAEQAGDHKALITLLQHAATPEIRKAAVLRKESAVRIAYLCHADTSADERAQLLDKERRADVFAGLIQASKQDESLRDRLIAQFQQKPTKALAKAFLRDGFPDTATEVTAAALLQNDRSLTDSVSRRMTRVIAAASKHDEHRVFLVGVLDVPFLLDIDEETLAGDEQVLFVTKLVDAHHVYTKGGTWEDRRIARNIESSLMKLCDSDKLNSDAAAKMVEIEDDQSFDTDFRGRLSSVLTARGVGTAEEPTQSDTLTAKAQSSTGVQLDIVVDYATGGDTASQALIEALLTNPAILTHAHVEEVISRAHARALHNAIRTTRSVDLFKVIYRVSGSTFAEQAWEFIDNPEDVAITLLHEKMSGHMSYYHSHREHTYLLETFPTERVLSSAPWSVMNSISRGWNSSVLEGKLGEMVQQMQLDKLGDDFGRWQQFNSLAQNWDGSFGDLLDAASSL